MSSAAGRLARLPIWAKAALALGGIAAALLILGYVMGVNPVEAAEKLPPSVVVEFLAIWLVMEALRAPRLLGVARILGGSSVDAKGLLRAYAARLIGDFINAVTPSIGGGEAARGIVVSGVSARGAVVGLVDGSIDLVSATLVAAALSPLVAQWKPLALMALLFGFAYSGAWVVLIYASPRLADRLAARFGLSESDLEALRRLRRLYPLLVAYSAPIWLLAGAQTLIVASNACSGCIGLVAATAAMLYSMLAGLVPTPAGVGPFEAVMAYMLCPEAAIQWRLAWIASCFTLGALGWLLLLLDRHLRLNS